MCVLGVGVGRVARGDSKTVGLPSVRSPVRESALSLFGFRIDAFAGRFLVGEYECAALPDGTRPAAVEIILDSDSAVPTRERIRAVVAPATQATAFRAVSIVLRRPTTAGAAWPEATKRRRRKRGSLLSRPARRMPTAKIDTAVELPDGKRYGRGCIVSILPETNGAIDASCDAIGDFAKTFLLPIAQRSRLGALAWTLDDTEIDRAERTKADSGERQNLCKHTSQCRFSCVVERGRL